MPLLTRRTLLLAKIETTFNTDATPVQGTDAFLVGDCQFTADITQNERNVYQQSLSKEATVPGRKIARVTFTHEIKGSGAGATAPKVGTLLRGCGFAQTVLAASAGHDYDPVSSGFESLTIYVYMDGLLHKMTGCMGNVSVSGEAGGYGVCNFDFQGSYVDAADATLPASPTFESTTPPVISAATMTLHGYASACAQSFSIDMGNSVVGRACMNSADGFKGVQITDRNPTGSVNPEAELVATFDVWGKFKSGAQGAFNITIGSTLANKCNITMPKTQFTNVQYGDRDGIRTNEITLALRRNAGAGNDEIKFNFQAT